MGSIRRVPVLRAERLLDLVIGELKYATRGQLYLTFVSSRYCRSEPSSSWQPARKRMRPLQHAHDWLPTLFTLD
jgi:hypothetical protein